MPINKIKAVAFDVADSRLSQYARSFLGLPRTQCKPGSQGKLVTGDVSGPDCQASLPISCGATRRCSRWTCRICGARAAIEWASLSV